MKKNLTLILAILLAALPLFVTAGCTARDGSEAETNAANRGVIYFDAASAGWENAGNIRFFISDIDEGELAPWGSKKLSGTEGQNGVWSFDAEGLGVQDGSFYTLILENADTNDMTYPLLMDSSCFGDIVRADSAVLENPTDSGKKCYEARWRRSSLGPLLQVTSIGNVTGETVAPNTTPYRMMVDFLAAGGSGGLAFALEYSGRDVQSSIDSVAGGLGLTKEEVAKAIEEAKTLGHSVTGEKADWSDLWSIDDFSVPEGSTRCGE